MASPQMTVKLAADENIDLGDVELKGPLGRKADAASVSQAWSTEDVALITALNTVLGLTSDPAVTTDAVGSLNAHVRGALVELIAILATAGATNDAAATAGSTGSLSAKLRVISDTLGATAGTAVITDVGGTMQQYLRGLVALWLAGVKLPATANSTATINNNASLSGAVDLGSSKNIVRIQMPALWTAANLTFQISDDGSNYFNVYDSYGVEYTVVAAASETLLIPIGDLRAVRYLKVRSGTNGTPVAQGGSRDLVVVAQ